MSATRRGAKLTLDEGTLSAPLAAAIAVAAGLGPPPAAFVAARTVEGVAASVATDDAGRPWGLAEGQVAASPEAILAHLLAFEDLPGRVPRLVEARVLSRDAGSALVYYRFDLPWPVSDRDYTVRYAHRREPDGRIVIEITDANSEGPPPGRAVRVTHVHGRFTLEPVADAGAPAVVATRLRYLFTAEFGGLLARSVKEQTTWKQALETLLGIRRALATAR